MVGDIGRIKGWIPHWTNSIPLLSHSTPRATRTSRPQWPSMEMRFNIANWETLTETYPVRRKESMFNSLRKTLETLAMPIMREIRLTRQLWALPTRCHTIASKTIHTCLTCNLPRTYRIKTKCLILMAGTNPKWIFKANNFKIQSLIKQPMACIRVVLCRIRKEWSTI